MLRVVEPKQQSVSATASQTADPHPFLPAAFQLWACPEVWCLGMTNITFGLCAGYMNGVVNGMFVAPNVALGTSSLGTLLALTSCVAACGSVLCSVVAQWIGRGIVLCIGSCAFAAIPASVLFVNPSAANDYWGVSLVCLFIFQGCG